MAGYVNRLLNRVFVTNVSWTVCHRELSEYFSQFGHVTSAKVIFDRSTGMSRGYGFVEFANKNDLDTVLNKKDHLLEGQFISVQLSTN